MCGIVGYIGNQKASNIIIKGLKRLEYRGYDSAGIAVINSETKNIICNALSPGGVINNQGRKFLSKIKSEIPIKRLANKNEYRSARQFLCSDASSYMTGHNLIIDGGRTIW